MNVNLLRKVKRHILAEPKRLVMSSIDLHGKPGSPTQYGGKFPKCGTAACIAGWAGALSGLKWETIYFEEAQEVLQIDAEQGARLFDPYLWPKKFRGGTRDDGTLKTARKAAERIEHFIATKGAE